MRFAMVVGMPDQYQDPSGNTEQFKAFMARQEAPPAAAAPVSSSKVPLIIGAVVVAVVVIALIAWLVA